MEEDRIKLNLALSTLDNLCLPVKKTISCSSWTYKDLIDNFRLTDVPHKEIDSTLSWLSSSKDNHLWLCTDEGFPSFEPIVHNNPFLLLYRGRKPDLTRKTVCITSTSSCDIRGLRKCFQMALEAGLCSFDLVTALHDSCDFSTLSGFNASSEFCRMRSRPIGVIDKGPDGPFTKTELFMQEAVLAAGGTIIYPFMCSHVRSAQDLKMRSLVMAALSRFVIAVQSPLRSHVLDTVDYALQMGRDVCTTTEGTGEGYSRLGSQSLAFDGAEVLDHFSEYLGKDYELFDTYECKSVDFRYPYASFLSSAYCLKHKSSAIMRT